MPRACAGTGSDQQEMVFLRRNNLIDEGIDRSPTAIDHALPADLHDVGIRQNAVIGGVFGRREQRRVRERSV